MTNVSHASLTGSQLHEPKGADSATLGTVYVADGAGSGSWSSVGTSAFTGMIADFAAPVAPTGWLELDGSTISTSTFSALYAVMATQTSGTRSSGSPVITSIPSTTFFRVGYFVFGTGITSGSTVISVDSATQITISNNTTSSGSAAFAVSPWLLNTGTIQLPDVTTVGRYRRSRTSATAVGQVQADQNQAHTHSGSTISGSTSSDGAHIHSVTDAGHSHGISVFNNSGSGAVPEAGSGSAVNNAVTQSATTGISIVTGGTHNHTVTGTATISSQGGTDTRPLTIIVLTCIKT